MSTKFHRHFSQVSNYSVTSIIHRLTMELVKTLLLTFMWTLVRARGYLNMPTGCRHLPVRLLHWVILTATRKRKPKVEMKEALERNGKSINYKHNLFNNFLSQLHDAN